MFKLPRSRAALRTSVSVLTLLFAGLLGLHMTGGISEPKAHAATVAPAEHVAMPDDSASAGGAASIAIEPQQADLDLVGASIANFDR